MQLSIFWETISSILGNWFTKSLMGFTFMQFDKPSIFKIRLLDIEPVFKDKILKPGSYRGRKNTSPENIKRIEETDHA